MNKTRCRRKTTSVQLSSSPATSLAVTMHSTALLLLAAATSYAASTTSLKDVCTDANAQASLPSSDIVSGITIHGATTTTSVTSNYSVSD